MNYNTTVIIVVVATPIVGGDIVSCCDLSVVFCGNLVELYACVSKEII